jgi:hypothetical protein
MTFLSQLDPSEQALTLYESEKRTGIRRANGARKLKKLSNRHLAMISMHVEGIRGEDIAKRMHVRGVTVSRVLNDPLVKIIISRIFSDRQLELDALAGKAINAVREGMDDKVSIRERLTAVDKYTKLKDSIGAEVSSVESAEDVVERIFKGVSIKDSHIQVNVGTKDDR